MSPDIRVERDGFELFSKGRSSAFVRWMEIKEIDAYKVDAVSYDLLCVSFRYRSGDKDLFVEVHEEAAGYRELMCAVETRFPVKQNWWREAVFGDRPEAVVVWRADVNE